MVAEIDIKSFHRTENSRMLRTIHCKAIWYRLAALLIGSFIGLVISIPDIQKALSQTHQSVSVRTRRSLPASWRPPPIVSKPGHLDPNDGIISTDEKPKVPQKPVVQKKAPLFNLDISKLGKLVNPHDFQYTIDPKESCEDNGIFLVAYIHTSPEHRLRRDVIRKTWGKASNYKEKTRVFFMLGHIESKELQSEIDKEAKQYKDIVQESFKDSYHNLSIKAVGAMRWVTSRCKQAKFILKTDDDVFVNLFSLLTHLKNLDTYNVNNTRLLMCLVWTRMHVLRDGKWGIPKSVIADEFYPHYCSGMAYVMSPDAASAIFRASEYVPFFWVDDVYMTGIIPKAIGLNHVDIGRLMFGRKEVEWLLSGDDWYKYLFSHLRDTDLYQEMWSKLVGRIQRDKIPQMNTVIAGTIAEKYGRKQPTESFVKQMDSKRNIAKGKAKAKPRKPE